MKSGSLVNPAMTVASAWCGDSTAVRASPEMNRMSYSDRAKAIAVSSSSESSSVSWSPPADKMAAFSTAVNANSSGNVQMTAGATPRCEPQPLPIVTATGFSGSAALSRLSAAASSVIRDYSPFNNALSQIIAESVLTKRTDDFDNWSSFATELVVPFDLVFDPDFCFWLACDTLAGCSGFILGNCCSNFFSVSLMSASMSDCAYFVASTDPLKTTRRTTSVMLHCC